MLQELKLAEHFGVWLKCGVKKRQLRELCFSHGSGALRVTPACVKYLHAMATPEQGGSVHGSPQGSPVHVPVTAEAVPVPDNTPEEEALLFGTGENPAGQQPNPFAAFGSRSSDFDASD